MNSRVSKVPAIAVDLFAGGGGLSLGLKQAGFVVSAAVESEPSACDTYSINHRGTVLFNRDIREISGIELIRTSPTLEIDFIAACPPCQGFSSLTSKYKKADLRNELIFEFVRLVEEVLPAAIMMENVPGLAKKGSSIFRSAMDRLSAAGYNLTQATLDVANFGIPQHRKRLVVLGGRGFPITIPPATHAEKQTVNQRPWVTVRDAIENFDRPSTLLKAIALGGPEVVNWHVTRSISPINLARLRATRAGTDRSRLPVELRPKCHQGSDSGFSNVYGRMSWDKPAPTITGGCTTLSKGRFGHPSLLRTISVREAATLQSFPLTYQFSGGFMEKVCDIIGNALPPRFAEIMAAACIDSIREQREKA